MMKTTFFKFRFFTVKYHRNVVKYCLLKEKDNNNTDKKNPGENFNNFLRFFLEVSVFRALTLCLKAMQCF
jgi:hypothetical protein